MNSCRSIELSAWTPPLITFSIGTGSVVASSPPRWRKSETPASAAAAFALASETPRIALAPSRPLFGVPSSSISVRSSPSWSTTSSPRTASAISPLTFATACETPLPPHAVAAVAQLDRLVHAGRGARGDDRPAEPARDDLDLDGRVPARVQNLAGVNVGDRLTRSLLRLVEVRVLPLERQLAPILARLAPPAPRQPRRAGGSAAPPVAARARDRPRACARRSTAAKRTSPSSSPDGSSSSSRSSSSRSAIAPARSGYSKPTAFARCWILRA